MIIKKWANGEGTTIELSDKEAKSLARRLEDYNETNIMLGDNDKVIEIIIKDCGE